MFELNNKFHLAKHILENKVKHIIVLISLLLVIGGCTVATKPIINQAAQTSINSPSVNNPPFMGLKRVVAIGRFSDESKNNSSFFVDDNNSKLGKQASDILSARLSASGKFVLLERSDISLINQENTLSNQQAQTVGAEYILLGSVSEFGRETTSDVGIFSRNKKQKATATVNVRLVNISTSEIIYSQEATGSATAEANQVFGVGEVAAHNTALDDKAISAAISKLTANIINTLMDKPWVSYLLSQQQGRYLIAGGTIQGIKSGDRFNVYLPGKKVTNPQTNKQIELPGKNVAIVEVTDLVGSGENEISVTKLVSGQISPDTLTDYRITEL